MSSAAGSGWLDVPFVTAPFALNGMQVSSARFADFGTDTASRDARHVADWIADSGDAAGFDFIIVDKQYAKVYVFGGDARLRASTPALLGAARGDDSVPGIGS